MPFLGAGQWSSELIRAGRLGCDNATHQDIEIIEAAVAQGVWQWQMHDDWDACCARRQDFCP